MWYTNYICSDCGNVFREDEIKEVYTMEGEGCMRGPMHDHDECPYCGSEAIAEARECIARCGYFSEEDTGSLDYCPSCQNAIHEQNEEHIENVKKYFNLDYEDAIELILFDLERRVVHG